jgi:hypothetical protein
MEIPFEDMVKMPFEMGDTDDTIHQKCAENYEGKCNQFGFVIPGSIELVKRSPPTYVIGSHEMVTYASIRGMCGMFQKGDTIQGKIVKLIDGVVASASVLIGKSEIGQITLPFELNVPDKACHLNEIVEIQILASSFGFGWDFIRGVGRLI